MNPETIEKLKEVFAPIALKIGEGAEYGWTVIIKQQYVLAVGSAIIALISAVVMGVGIWLIRRGLKYQADSHYDSTKEVMTAIGIGITALGTVVLGFSSFDVIARLINPDYYAIQFLMQMVSGPTR